MPRIGGALDIVQVGDPASPQAGREFLYFKSDGLLYSKDPGGTIRQIGAAPANMVTTDTPQSISGAKTFTGTVIIGNKALWNGSRALTVTATNTVDLGTFTSTNGAMQLNIMMTVNASTYSVSKTYELDIASATGSANTWYKVLPQDATQNSGAATDFALEVNRNATTNAYSFRIRQIGTTAATLYFQAEGWGDNTVSFAPSTTVTAAPAAVSTIWSPTPLYTGPGRVGVNTDNPAYELDVVGIAQATAHISSGLTGATAASRYVGGTASGAPTAGTFAVGDYVIAQNGVIWICTAAGTPGTWAQPAGGGAGVIVAEEGTPLTQRPTLNFVGALVTAVDNAGSTRTDVTVATPTPAQVGAVNKTGDTMSGQLNVTVDTPGTGTAGTDTSSGLRSGTRASLITITGFGSYVVDNLYFDGTNWRYRANIGMVSSFITLKSTGMEYWTAPASGVAGSIATMTRRFIVDPTGALQTPTVIQGLTGVYDGSNRVYSASYPPPVSGMSVLGGASVTTSATINTGVAGITFVAPSTGRVIVDLTCTMTSGSNQVAISLDNSTWQFVGGTLYFNPNGYLTPYYTFGKAVFTGLTSGATYTVYHKSQNVASVPIVYAVEG